MFEHCSPGTCRTPCWMTRVLIAAGIYHLLFGLWVNLFPTQYFDWFGMDQPTHMMMWRSIGIISGMFGLGFLIAARSPVRHWGIVLIGFLKVNLVLLLFIASLMEGSIHISVGLLVCIDDLIWWLPLASILWASVEAHAGRPPSGDPPLSIEEASAHYRLSSDETLAEASQKQMLVMVFLRHFGCTFTRKILQELQQLKDEADARGARLVLVHMLSSGGENNYMPETSGGVARIADPMCELYRAFGIGKGGFMELFGPRVWLPLGKALIQGCGAGHIAGDGLQLPGAFLFHHGRIVSSQRARTQALLPDLPGLFEELPEREMVENVPA